MKKSGDIIDRWIKSVNWKVGNFSMLPIFFGVVLALVDIVMMNTTKMVTTGTLSAGFGLPLAFVTYGMEPLIFFKALKYEGMVVTNLVWNMVSNVIVTLSGVLIFGETIKGLRWIGISMSIIALGIFAYTND